MYININSTGRTGKAVIMLLISFCFVSLARGQKEKGPLQLADEYFAAGEYYTAAELYGQYLNPPLKQQNTASDFPLNIKGKNNAAYNPKMTKAEVLLKQAESYRLAHYWDKAAAIYKQYAADNGKESASALYWYAICQRSLGNYAGAKETLEQAKQSAPDKKTAEQINKELQTLTIIEQQQQRADSILFTVKKLDAINSSQNGVFAVTPAGNNQYIVSSTIKDSVSSAGENPYRSRLFTASLVNDQLTELTPIPFTLDNPMTNAGAATISPDGKYIYFTQWGNQEGKNMALIYYAEKTNTGWGEAKPLTTIIKEGYSNKQPFCSADGKYLFFSSNRPGTKGKYDIWYAPLKKDGTTGNAVNAGNSVNTTANEVAPYYQSSSNTLVFSSDAGSGMGGYDLYAARGSAGHWETATNLGNPVNSSRDDIYFFAPENSALLSSAIISSDRGSGCCLESYQVIKQPKDKTIDGIVLDQADNTPVEGVTVTLKDMNGKSWQVITDAEGKYSFDLKKETYSNLSVSVSKESYKDTSVAFAADKTDENDLLKDIVTSRAVYIGKIPPPEPEIVIKAEDVVTVYFDFDKHAIKPDAAFKLDSIYNVMTENPEATIQVSGYTDGLGSEEYNKLLSDKRARACADYLIAKGIDEKRITFVSFGSCCPVEMEKINGRDNPDGRSLNRRALINIKK